VGERGGRALSLAELSVEVKLEPQDGLCRPCLQVQHWQSCESGAPRSLAPARRRSFATGLSGSR